MQNSEDLVVKIIKAKYYHRQSFLEAKLGTQPSYVAKYSCGAGVIQRGLFLANWRWKKCEHLGG